MHESYIAEGNINRNHPCEGNLAISLPIAAAQSLWPAAPILGTYPVDSLPPGQKGPHQSCFQQKSGKLLNN